MSKYPCTGSEDDFIPVRTVYALLLEGDNYYIGITTDYLTRMSNHRKGEGSKWTALHKFIDVIEIIPGALISDEKRLTIKYMHKYGWQKVRGGPWCNLEYKSRPKYN